MTATLPEDCPRSGLASAPLSLARDTSAPQAPQVLPVGAPALVFAFEAPPLARSAGRPKALDRHPVDTTLRI